MFRLAAGALQSLDHPISAEIVERVDYDLCLSLPVWVVGQPGGDDITSKPIVCHCLEVMFLDEIMIQKNQIIVALGQPLNCDGNLIGNVTLIFRKPCFKPPAAPLVVFDN